MSDGDREMPDNKRIKRDPESDAEALGANTDDDAKAFKAETDDEEGSNSDKEGKRVIEMIAGALEAAERAVEKANTLKSLIAKAGDPAKNTEKKNDQLVQDISELITPKPGQRRTDSEASDSDEFVYFMHMVIPAKSRIKYYGEEEPYEVIATGTIQSTTNIGGFSMNMGVEFLTVYPSGMVIIGRAGKDESGGDDGDDDEKLELRGYIVDQNGDDVSVLFHGAQGSYKFGRVMEGDPDGFKRLLEEGFRSVKVVEATESEVDHMGGPLAMLNIAMQLDSSKRSD